MGKKIILSILEICLFFVGFGMGIIAAINVLDIIVEEYRKSSDKFGRLFRLMNQWVQLKQEGKSISGYFEKRHYRNIAIYGMGSVGEAIIRDLLNSKVNVKYAIDQKANENSKDFVVSPNSILEMVDAIVVTPISSYGEIKLHLKEKIDCPIISIEDILYEI